MPSFFVLVAHCTRNSKHCLKIGSNFDQIILGHLKLLNWGGLYHFREAIKKEYIEGDFALTPSLLPLIKTLKIRTFC